MASNVFIEHILDMQTIVAKEDCITGCPYQVWQIIYSVSYVKTGCEAKLTERITHDNRNRGGFRPQHVDPGTYPAQPVTEHT